MWFLLMWWLLCCLLFLLWVFVLVSLLLMVLVQEVFVLLLVFVVVDFVMFVLCIGVVIMQLGEIFFECFGYDVLVVVDLVIGVVIFYNFGYFDLFELDFIGCFVCGEMMYYLVVLLLEQDLFYYCESGCGVSIQWLDLDLQQVCVLVVLLVECVKLENVCYYYDYYIVNCVMMVCDVVDQVFGGGLYLQLFGCLCGNIYCSELVWLVLLLFWMWLGFDIGLGLFVDVLLLCWQEVFVLMCLVDVFCQVCNSDGCLLVQVEQVLLLYWIVLELVELVCCWWFWLLCGLIVVVGVVVLCVWWCWLGGIVLLFWLFCGIVGVLLIYLWGFSVYQVVWVNCNLLQFLLLCLLLLFGVISLLCGCQLWCGFCVVLWVVVLLFGLGLVLYWLILQVQYNLQWIVLLLLIYIVLVWVLGCCDLFVMIC